MKRISLLIILLTTVSFLLCSCDSKQDIDEQSTDYNDEIIAIIEKSPSLTAGNLITKADTDKDGNVIVTYYDNNDNPVEEYIWNGDKKISHTVMQYAESGLLSTKEEISHDGQSNIVYFYSYSDNGTLTGTTKSTYKNGLLVRTDTLDAHNNISAYIVNSYNNNFITKAERFDGDNKLLGYSTYDYNEKSLISKYSTYSESDKLMNYTTIEYNSDGQKISEKYFNDNNALLSNHITAYYDSGEIKSITVYDNNGNILSSETFQQQ